MWWAVWPVFDLFKLGIFSFPVYTCYMPCWTFFEYYLKYAKLYVFSINKCKKQKTLTFLDLNIPNSIQYLNSSKMQHLLVYIDSWLILSKILSIWPDWMTLHRMPRKQVQWVKFLIFSLTCYSFPVPLMKWTIKFLFR